MLLTRPVARWRVLAVKYLVMVAVHLAGGGGRGAAVLADRGLRLRLARLCRAGADRLSLRPGRRGSDQRARGAAVDGHPGHLGPGLVRRSGGRDIGTTFSVLFRSTAAAMGTFMAVLAGGTLLGQLASDWELAKWLFVTNLPLVLSGVPPVGHDGGQLGGGAAGVGGQGRAGSSSGSFSRRDVVA